MFLPPQEKYEQTDIEKAQQVMLSALSLASSPSIPPTKAAPDQQQGPALALSLGPFGAQCQPGQEYAGLYPAPFGSKPTPSNFGFSPRAGQVIEPLPLDEVRLTSLMPQGGGASAPRTSEQDHLAAWHLTRLRHFAASADWSSIGVIAFETIPILTELKAIRQAMVVFNDEERRRGRDLVPFYVSFVFPLDERGEAKFPDADMQTLELDEQLSELMTWCYAPVSGPRPTQERDLPAGVGINCSNPDHIGRISDALSRALDQILPRESEVKPWLVVYPDGGAVYDAVFTKTWSNPSGMDEQTWAEKLATTVSKALTYRRSNGTDDLFGGVVAGGCCKAGPSYIKALRKVCEDKGLL
ncbi:AdoMet-homocysteine methyltransferase [Microbotryomycetes sp. JL201]|nr:AdoMet-homocysteine methyltransferase [Microbotryomycetes sp. JL201]